MKVIDFHTHIFPDSLAERAINAVIDFSKGVKNFTDGTSSGLIQSMIASNVSQSVLLPVATKASQVRQINQTAATNRSEYFIPFGALHPQSDNFLDEIQFLVDSNIKGVKLHPEYQNFIVDSKEYYPMYGALEGSGLITVFHAGRDPGPYSKNNALPSAFKKIHSEFPSLKIVAAHLGGFDVWDEVLETLCGEGVWFDTSAVMGSLDDRQVVEIIQKNGVDKILFGTDSPWFDQLKMIQWIERLPISTLQKESILYSNALTLLG